MQLYEESKIVYKLELDEEEMTKLAALAGHCLGSGPMRHFTDLLYNKLSTNTYVKNNVIAYITKYLDESIRLKDIK